MAVSANAPWQRRSNDHRAFEVAGERLLVIVNLIQEVAGRIDWILRHIKLTAALLNLKTVARLRQQCRAEVGHVRTVRLKKHDYDVHVLLHLIH